MLESQISCMNGEEGPCQSGHDEAPRAAWRAATSHEHESRGYQPLYGSTLRVRVRLRSFSPALPSVSRNSVRRLEQRRRWKAIRSWSIWRRLLETWRPLNGRRRLRIIISFVGPGGARELLRECPPGPFRLGAQMRTSVRLGRRSSVVSLAVSIAYAVVAWLFLSPGVARAQTPPPPEYPDLVLSQNPVAYFRLGETSIALGTTAEDSSSVQNDGFYTANWPDSNPPAAESGGAAYCEGNGSVYFSLSNNYAHSPPGQSNWVQVPHHSSYLPTQAALTVEAWVTATTSAQAAYAGIVTKATGTYDTGYGFYYHGNTIYFYVSTKTYSVGVPISSIVASNQFHHLVGTYNGSQILLYLDGVQVGSKAVAIGAPLPSSAPLTIGKGLYQFGWAGLIDEVAVYPSVLTAAQILEHYNVARATRTRLWSDSRAWRNGVLPTYTTEAKLTGACSVVLDVDNVEVDRITIDEGATLRFDPTKNLTLSSVKNVVVRGTLEMLPPAGVTHTLRITGADETAFVGSTTPVVPISPVATDIGLWVLGGGKLNVSGAAKTAWLRAAGDLLAGDDTIQLTGVPALWDWAVGDEIAIVPTSKSNLESSTSGEFEVRTIRSVDDAQSGTVSLGSVTNSQIAAPLMFDHPSASLPAAGQLPARTLGAEVLNLSRNARIEGMPPNVLFPRPSDTLQNRCTCAPCGSPACGHGRAHILIQNDRPVQHNLRNVALRHLGPRKKDPIVAKSRSLPISGRQALQFYHSGSNNVGVLVDNLVVRNAGSHAIVPVGTTGVFFTDAIAYDVVETPFWWDSPNTLSPTQSQIAASTSNFIVWDHSVAALVHSDALDPGYEVSGFQLGIGSDNYVAGSVAVGVQGTPPSAGFHAPMFAIGSANSWIMEDNLSHNNKSGGFDTLQDDNNDHLISSFATYRNQGPAISLGKAQNRYSGKSVALYDDGWAVGRGTNEAFVLRAGSGNQGADGRIRWEDVAVDVAGELPHILAIASDSPVSSPSTQTESLLIDWSVKGHTAQPITVDLPTGVVRKVDLVGWRIDSTERDLEPSDFEFNAFAQGNVIRVQRRDCTAYTITPNANNTASPVITPMPAFRLAPDTTCGTSCAGNCSASCPCPIGGVCSNASDCGEGLVCGSGNGAFFGLSRATNVCWSPWCEADPFSNCGWAGAPCGSTCSAATPCQSDSDCTGGEVCGVNNGPRFSRNPGRACWKPVCETAEVDSNCHTVFSDCGRCTCTPSCSNVVCGGTATDGCGGRCGG